MNSTRKKVTYMVMGAMPPHSTDVLWLDISDGAAPILKMFINGNWEAVTTDTLVEDEIIGMYCIKEPGGEEKPTITVDLNNLQNNDWSSIDDYLTGGSYLVNVNSIGDSLCGGILTVYDYSSTSSYLEVMQAVLVGEELIVRVKYSGTWSPFISHGIPTIDDTNNNSTKETWSCNKINTEIQTLKKADNFNHTILFLTSFNVEDDEDLINAGLLTSDELSHFHQIYPNMGGIDFLGLKGTDDRGSISVYVEGSEVGTLYWFGDIIDGRHTSTQWLDIVGNEKFKREFNSQTITWGEWNIV